MLINGVVLLYQFQTTTVDWVINKYDEADDEQKVSVIDNLVAFFSSLSKEKAEQIEKAKGQRGGDTKETIIIVFLTNSTSSSHNLKELLLMSKIKSQLSR